MIAKRVRALLTLVIATSFAVGCGGGSGSVSPVPRGMTGASGTSGSPIKHVVIVIQENRSFNDFFATFPGADGTTVGKVKNAPDCSPPIKKGTINLRKVDLLVKTDMDHRYAGYVAEYDRGKMDGFDVAPYGNGTPECTYPYQYTDPAQIKPYWDMATQYTLAEHMFMTQGSDSFTAHQDLIRGDTVVQRNKAMIDLPSCSGTRCWWGCDAPPNTHTSLITKDNVYLQAQGPFPCTTHFKKQYPTVRDLLDAKGVSWKYYVPASNTGNGKLLNAFDAIWPVRNGSEWGTNVDWPETKIFDDITANELPSVSWVIPDAQNSDHPGSSSKDTGPSWVASIVNAIGQSPYWQSTAIVILWDDWGGLYDNKAPKILDYGGLGFRVPAIVVSPYARAGNISTTNYEFGSILRYVEENWNLGSLNTTDKRATSIIDCFNYSQTPINFIPIGSKYKKSYFLRQRPSGLPVDTDM